MSNSSVTYGFIDHSGEQSKCRIRLPQITAANYDTVVNDGVGGNVGDIRVGLLAVTRGNLTTRPVTADVFRDTPTIPADEDAQREDKLVITYVDSVTNSKYTLEIPTADRANLAQPNTDEVPLTDVNLAIFVSAFEANAVTKDGNAPIVTRAKLSSRNI